MINKVLYLGPKGSYSELAKNKFCNAFFSTDCEFLPEDSIYKIIRLLKESDSETTAAVIPIENSIEGIVRDSQDNLISLAEKGIRIQAETCLTIKHCLIGYASEKNEINKIISHPQALAQCREYIYANWENDINLSPVMSTSQAVSVLSENDSSAAAIASEYCAELYKVPIIESCINDEKNNTTRFVLLSKIAPSKTDSNKVSITFSTENKSGALNRVLSILEKHGINMSYIDSRPSRKELGEYIFYIDFAGHINDSNISMALIEIQPHIRMFEVLSEGSICV